MGNTTIGSESSPLPLSFLLVSHKHHSSRGSAVFSRRPIRWLNFKSLFPNGFSWKLTLTGGGFCSEATSAQWIKKRRHLAPLAPAPPLTLNVNTQEVKDEWTGCPGGIPGPVPAERPWASVISVIRHTCGINAAAQGLLKGPEGTRVCASFTSSVSQTLVEGGWRRAESRAGRQREGKERERRECVPAEEPDLAGATEGCRVPLWRFQQASDCKLIH